MGPDHLMVVPAGPPMESTVPRPEGVRGVRRGPDKAGGEGGKPGLGDRIVELEVLYEVSHGEEWEGLMSRQGRVLLAVSIFCAFTGAYVVSAKVDGIAGFVEKIGALAGPHIGGGLIGWAGL